MGQLVFQATLGGAVNLVGPNTASNYNLNVPAAAGTLLYQSGSEANGTLLIGNGTGYAANTLTAGSGVSITNGSGSITISATGSGGTVTSVGLSVPSFLSVTGSPVTSSGTLAVSYSGTALPVANGGTGLTTAPTNGQIDIGSTGVGFVRTTITAGTGISVTNGAGSITIASTGGGSTSIGLVRAIAINCILC